MSRGERSRVRRVGGLVLCLGIVVACVIGIVVTVDRLIIPSDWAEATGRLTSVERDGPDRKESFRLTYSFEVDGQTYTATSFRGSEGELGSTAPIRYDPDDPTQAAVVGFWDRLILYFAVLLLVGILLGSLLGVAEAFDKLRSRKAA